MLVMNVLTVTQIIAVSQFAIYRTYTCYSGSIGAFTLTALVKCTTRTVRSNVADDAPSGCNSPPKKRKRKKRSDAVIVISG